MSVLVEDHPVDHPAGQKLGQVSFARRHDGTDALGQPQWLDHLADAAVKPVTGDFGFEHRRVDLKGPEDEVGIARRSRHTVLTICLVQVIHLDGELAHGGKKLCQSLRVLFGLLFEHPEHDDLLEPLVFLLRGTDRPGCV